MTLPLYNLLLWKLRLDEINANDEVTKHTLLLTEDIHKASN